MLWIGEPVPDTSSHVPSGLSFRNVQIPALFSYTVVRSKAVPGFESPLRQTVCVSEKFGPNFTPESRLNGHNFDYRLKSELERVSSYPQ